MDNLLAKSDPVQIFLTYMSFAGDVRQTAHVLQVDPAAVVALEADGNWRSKIKELVELSSGKDPGEYKLAVNRSVNYVQSHRLRSLLDRVLTVLTEKSNEELVDLLTTTGPKGNSFSTRPLTDLTKACETAQLMTRLALGDVGAGQLAEDEGKGSDIALSVMRAMQAASDLQVSPAPLVKSLP